MSVFMFSVMEGGRVVYSAAERSVVDVVYVVSVCVILSVVVSVGSSWWKNGSRFKSDWTSCVGSFVRMLVHAVAAVRAAS